MSFKDIVIDTQSRDWVSEYADMFDGQPISYCIADIIGSSVTTSTKFYFNFPKLTKIYKFIVSWNDAGFDEHDIVRLEKVHSIRREKKKGQSVRGRGLRCVIENFYKDIDDIQSEEDIEKCTRFLSRSKNYKNGEITAIVFAPNMRIMTRKAMPEEEQKFIAHMHQKHETDYGIVAEFRVNTDRAQEIFVKPSGHDMFKIKKLEVQPQIIKDIQLILNRRLVNEDGSSGVVSLVINDKEYRPSVRFIHSNTKQRYLCLTATIGKRKLGNTRGNSVFCLRLSDDSLDRIQQLRKENSDMRHLEDIKRYINLHCGAGNARKNCKARKYLDGQDGWMMDNVRDFESEKVDMGNGIWKEKELELRISVSPPPENERGGEYLKNTSGSSGIGAIGACGIFVYHNNTIVNLRGIYKLTGLTKGRSGFHLGPGVPFLTAQIPCVEIEEMNIGLGDSKIFTTKAVKAASVQFKVNTNFYIALSEFINCFLKHHMYFRNITEEEVEEEKKKKEQAKLEQALKEQAISESEEDPEEEEESDNEILSPPTVHQIMKKAETISPAPISKNFKIESPQLKTVDDIADKSAAESSEESEESEEEEIVSQVVTNMEHLEQKNAQEEVQSEIIQQKQVKKRPPITKANKEMIAQEQAFRCNNSPNGPIVNKNANTGCEEYECPMWQLYDGHFDKSLYEIDHIDQNRTNIYRANLQALCPCCHSVKTRENQRKSLPKDKKLEFIE